ncbi:RNA polymerase sigma factor [Bacillus paranthracis]
MTYHSLRLYNRMRQKRRERPIEEKQLIEKSQQGSEHAFRILVQTYRHYIFQVIFSILRHEEDAKDVTQEVFVKNSRLSPKLSISRIKNVDGAYCHQSRY